MLEVDKTGAGWNQPEFPPPYSLSLPSALFVGVTDGLLRPCRMRNSLLQCSKPMPAPKPPPNPTASPRKLGRPESHTMHGTARRAHMEKCEERGRAEKRPGLVGGWWR